MIDPTTFPATMNVHWPTGTIALCDAHAARLRALCAHMGWMFVATQLLAPAVCEQCVEEAAEKEPLTGRGNHS